jgi:hypothetical protein
MMRLDKMGYSADFGGEAAVKRPSPLPLLVDSIKRSQYSERHE